MLPEHALKATHQVAELLYSYQALSPEVQRSLISLYSNLVMYTPGQYGASFVNDPPSEATEIMVADSISP